MRKVNSLLKTLWKDESGQGATEYILLLVVVVGLAMIFKKQIFQTVSDKLGTLATEISGFSSTSN